MDAATRISGIGALLGEPARARILTTLLDGRAHTATELAWAADVMPSTVSSHLKKLYQANLVALDRQGRHRYFRLRDETVAQALEALLRVDSPPRPTPVTGPADPKMRTARTCYDHLAGRVAVALTTMLIERGHLQEGDDAFTLTPSGADWFRVRKLNAEVDRSSRRKFAPRCMDWSERRAHIGGALGAKLLHGLESQAIVVREPGTRQVTVSPFGKRWLKRHAAADASRETLRELGV